MTTCENLLGGREGVMEIDCGDSYICQNSQNCLLNFTVCKLYLCEMKG